MKRFLVCIAGALTVALVGSAQGQDGNQTPLASNASFNYSVQPGFGEGAYGMYPAPYWAPPVVGYSSYSYAPLMPHEHLYAHRRVYGPGGDTGACSNGGTRTRVVWHAGCSHVGPAAICFHGRRGATSAGCGVASSGCTTGDCGGGSK
jgi:hypothetical protein